MGTTTKSNSNMFTFALNFSLKDFGSVEVDDQNVESNKVIFRFSQMFWEE